MVLGSLQVTAVTDTITVGAPASDPDGDPLTYTWAATNGQISGSGLTATWKRVIADGHLPLGPGTLTPGDATITAQDGRGGTASFTFHG